MSESELTPEARADLRAALESRRAELLEELSGLRAAEGATEQTPGAVSRAEEVGDSGDDSVDLEEDDRDYALVADLQQQLAEVEHALAKFETGGYGLSERSGRPIPLPRLRAIPETRYDAQDEAELEVRQDRNG